jgi:SsrA-binding protein
MPKDKEKFAKEIQIKNKRASFEYFFIDTYIAGLLLTGTEIKSIRMGNVNLTDGFCYFKSPTELVVKGLHISRYNEGTYNNHDPLRDRVLLLKRKELKKLNDKADDQGITIIPVRLFINERGWAKLEIALAKGKKLYDKRDSIKEKDVKREMSRTGME